MRTAAIEIRLAITEQRQRLFGPHHVSHETAAHSPEVERLIIHMPNKDLEYHSG